MAGPSRREPRRSVWSRIKRLLGLGQEPPVPPPEPPDEEPALVTAGRPRKPPPAGAVALEEPEPPEDVDARGREAD